jgi:creatinine amidohydrolase
VSIVEHLALKQKMMTFLRQEEGGTHAGEIETSMMLFIAPSTVDMTKAVKDYHPSPKNRLTRNPNGEGTYSASGIYGDATLATWQKGEIVVRALVEAILKEILDLASGTAPSFSRPSHNGKS